MPITQIPAGYLSDTLAKMQKQIDELTRAVGRPNDQIRDVNDNVVEMVPGTSGPVIAGRSHDVGISLADGSATVTDGAGRDTKPLAAQSFNGPLVGDSTGTHHGDVGVSGTEFYNHFGDQHGNCYGFHYGPVGDGASQSQINALNIFSTGHFGTQHGDVGIPGDNWALFGHVIAPSERAMKHRVRSVQDTAGMLVDIVESFAWHWRPDAGHLDDDRHVGPMVDDIETVAPWLVHRPDPQGPRHLVDRDLIGILWAALREERAKTIHMEYRISQLEAKER
jgi:hypothetical protein